jgi:hypothetical protein
VTDPGAAALQVQQAIDREVELVTSAISLVASGGAPSIVVAGMHLTEPVIEILRPIASERGVVIEPLYGPDETINDVLVRRWEPTA